MKRLMIYCILFLTVAACTKKEKPLCDGEKTSYAIINYIGKGEDEACVNRIILYSDYFETSFDLVYALSLPEEFRENDLKVKISYCPEGDGGVCPTFNRQPIITITKIEKINK